MIAERERWISGCSVAPGKAALYQLPERWVIHGRSSRGSSGVPKLISVEEKVRRNTGRVISRYWQAVGWLWMRSTPEVVDLGKGRKLRHRQGFLTLTLPGVATEDHKAIKAKVLDPFFTYCRNVLGLRDYVWTAELQDRGEIHFHAIVNQFLPKDKVRSAWLGACDRSGIVSSSGRGSRPATEIEECKDWNGSRIYAGKYLAKALRSGDIVGRVWSGSHSVTGIGSISTTEVDQAFDVPGILSEIKRAQAQWRQHDHGISTARYDVGAITRRRSPLLYRLFKRHLHNIDTQPQADALPQFRSDTAPRPSGGQPINVPSRSHVDPARGSQVGRAFPISSSGMALDSATPRPGTARRAVHTAVRVLSNPPDLWSIPVE